MNSQPQSSDEMMLPATIEAEKRFNRKVFGFLLAGFLVVILSFGATIAAFTANQDSDAEIVSTYQVIDQLSQVETQVERITALARGYLAVQDNGILTRYKRERGELAAIMANMKDRIEQDEHQRERFQQLRELIAGEMESVDRIMRHAVEGNITRARMDLSIAFVGYPLEEIRDKAAELRKEELALLDSRRAEEKDSTKLAQWIMGVTLLLLILSKAGTVGVLRRYIHQLGQSRDRLHRLNTDLEGAVAERTADLTRANDEIQRFAYIVSHDLRSPLVNMMGFTSELERAAKDITAQFKTVEEKAPDLVSQDARYAVEEDLPESIGFIKSSTQKMDRLINAILGLSRQGRRVLAPVFIDMNEMLDDIADNLTSQTEDQGATIHVEKPLPTIRHDRLAVEQIFTNIVENAVKYLTPDRPGKITVRGREVGERAIFEIEDNGRGIAPEDRERIFELFRRAGAQDQRGEGIGLAHVRNMIYRLNGTIDVKSELGEGSTFVVELPVRSSDFETAE